MPKELSNDKDNCDFIIDRLKKDLPPIYEIYKMDYQSQKRNQCVNNLSEENNFDIQYGIRRLEEIATEFSIDLK